MHEKLEQIIFYFLENKRKLLSGFLLLIAAVWVLSPKNSEKILPDTITKKVAKEMQRDSSLMKKNDVKVLEALLFSDQKTVQPYLASYLSKISGCAPFHKRFIQITLMEDSEEARNAAYLLKEDLSCATEGKEILYGYLLLEIAERERALRNPSKEKEAIMAFSEWMKSHPSLYASFSHLKENGVAFIDFFLSSQSL